MNIKICKGFTLIELMVVVVILGILSTIGLSTFKNSQIRSRDAKRKSNLSSVQRAVEMYYNDYGAYPSSSADGKIVVGGESIAWGSEFKDAKDTIYMKELPSDSTGSSQYCYLSSGSGYKIYAKLENTNDDQSCLDDDCTTARSCGSYTYNYGVSSPNVEP